MNRSSKIRCHSGLLSLASLLTYMYICALLQVGQTKMKAIVALLFVCTFLFAAAAIRVDAAEVSAAHQLLRRKMATGIRTAAGTRTANALCLTFDDGPFGVTADILKQLKTLNVHATFFLNCHADASGTADIVKTMVNDGHLLGNHMYVCLRVGCWRNV